MTERRWIILLGALLLALAATATVWAASAGQAPDPQGPSLPVGTAFTYQGRLRDGGEPVNDTCDMAFQLFDGIGPGDRPVGDTISLKVPVSEGLFTVELDFGGAAFRGAARWLGVTVQCPGDKVPVNLGRQELTAVPYALYALEAPWGGLPYAGVVVVAKSGGDFSSVQAAIDSISGASAERPYLVWIAPGVYEEQVTMKPHVHLQGAGQEATVISSTAGGGTPNAGTLTLASETSLRALTVGNTGANEYNVGVLATAATTDTLVADVGVWVHGGGDFNFGLFLGGSGTEIMLQQVSALAENGSETNTGLVNSGGAAVRLRGGSFTGRGGEDAAGVSSSGSGTSLDAEALTALGKEGTYTNVGLANGSGALASLRGGSYAGDGGSLSKAISNWGTNSLLEAESVHALAENGSVVNCGFSNSSSAEARLHGGSYIGHGWGTGDAIGICSEGTSLEAGGVYAQGAHGGNDYGLWNSSGTTHVTQSVLEGSLLSVLREGGTVLVSNSRLDGGPVDDDLVSCVAVSWGYMFWADTCP